MGHTSKVEIAAEVRSMQVSELFCKSVNILFRMVFIQFYRHYSFCLGLNIFINKFLSAFCLLALTCSFSFSSFFSLPPSFSSSCTSSFQLRNFSVSRFLSFTSNSGIVFFTLLRFLRVCAQIFYRVANIFLMSITDTLNFLSNSFGERARF